MSEEEEKQRFYLKPRVLPFREEQRAILIAKNCKMPVEMVVHGQVVTVRPSDHPCKVSARVNASTRVAKRTKGYLEPG